MVYLIVLKSEFLLPTLGIQQYISRSLMIPRASSWPRIVSLKSFSLTARAAISFKKYSLRVLGKDYNKIKNDDTTSKPYLSFFRG